MQTNSANVNQNPEQKARDNIDAQLKAAGWSVQSKSNINLSASKGVAVREYSTDTGPMDYLLFVDGEPCGLIEAKQENEAFHLSTVEEQSDDYAQAKLKHLGYQNLSFIYESTGVVTRFRDIRVPQARAREIFTFFKPEMLATWLAQPDTLRARLKKYPVLPNVGLRDCQFRAISNLEKSFAMAKPRALIQMATGAGKTYTAITAAYRLLKYGGARRILFLVDTKNLGEQAEQEFNNYLPLGEQHKFPDLYPVQRLHSSTINNSSRVCISTIQRMYSILQGCVLDESAEETIPEWRHKEPVPVAYTHAVPPEFFDVVIIDECHRSIYNLWKQVLDYFDAFLVGLTATPDNRTYAFFNQNVVSEYTHEQAVIDGVNVGYDVYTIETEITQNGAKISAEQYIEKRERLSRKKHWEQQDEELEYSSKDLDSNVVSPSQIRTIIREFKDKLPVIFPGREEVPKTLIFAKDDSHAEDIISIVREEFGEGDRFCKKITYRAKEDPKSVLAQFRNEFNPRIAVTVDMIATGTDVKPLECLIFMRDVRSKNYFEQMKGRGTRTLGKDDLEKVTPSAKTKKTHFIIVDAVGVCKTVKTTSRPLERKPKLSLKELLDAASVHALDEDMGTSLAGRLLRLNASLEDTEQAQILKKTGGVPLNQIAAKILDAFDPDIVEAKTVEVNSAQPQLTSEAAEQKAREVLKNDACSPFTGDLNNLILIIKKTHEQIIDTENVDKVKVSDWDKDAIANAETLVEDFAVYLKAHVDELTALQIFYNEPYRRRELTLKMIKELLAKIEAEKPQFAPERVWHAYYQLGKTKETNITPLTALVSIVRFLAGVDKDLRNYASAVAANFQAWTMDYNAHHPNNKLTPEQTSFLRMIRDHVASSFHIEPDDLDYTPFNAIGGLYRLKQLFGDDALTILNNLNEALAA